MGSRLVILLILLISIFFGESKAQDKYTLESKRNEYLEKIEYTNKLLEKNRKRQNLTSTNLNLIIQQVETRKLLVLNIESEIDYLNERIMDNEFVISSINEDLQRIKEEYEKLIYYAYKNQRTTNLWLFIFASKNFNQAYRRYKYLVEYTKYRKKQKELILSIKDLLVEKNDDLKDKRLDKQELLFAYSRESSNLRKEIASKELYISQLKDKERQLKKEIEVNKRNERRIADEIARLIAKEKERTKVEAEKDKVITSDFLRNLGKLQWPVETGIIVSEYGEHYHPVLKEVKINNPGIDISTNENASVYAIYDGEVSGIYGILGSNNTVIVKHGDFYSVYQNVIDLRVKIGTKLRKGDIIGKVYTDSKTNSSLLHFQIWEGKKTVDPNKWIAKNN